MTRLRIVIVRLVGLVRKGKLEAELEAEIQSHLEMQAEDNVRDGMGVTDAHLAARRSFGGTHQMKENYRDFRGVPAIETVMQDLRHGARMLAKNPGFTLAAVLTLAIGIGANTGIFTLVHTVLVRPLPYPDSERIVNIAREGGGAVSVPMFVYFAENNPGFEDLAAYQRGTRMALTGGDRPDSVSAMRVSADYFPLFGASAILGRTFDRSEDRPGGNPVVILSYGVWQTQFGGDASALGTAVTLAQVPHEIIGVISEEFQPYPSADLWIPLKADPISTGQAHVLTLSGRLRQSTTLNDARSQMTLLGRQYVEAHPEQLGGDDRLEVVPLQQALTGDARPPLMLFLWAVGLLLLLACANVANLLLARGTGRRAEVAIRAAIGAGRRRIVRQLLTEGVLLALLAGGVGLMMGALSVRVLMTSALVDLPRVPETTSVPLFDPWVTGFTLVLALGTVAVFGPIPAVRLSHIDLMSSLRRAAVSGEEPHHRTQAALVATEIGLAVMVVCSAALLMQSFSALQNVSLGFNPDNLVALDLSLTDPDYGNSGNVERLAMQVVGLAEQMPGVEAAAFTSALPLEGFMDIIFDIPGRPHREGRAFTGNVQWRFVSANYFDVLEVPLLAGRPFHDREGASTALINQTLADEFWPDTNPVGQTILVGQGLGFSFESRGLTEIVGVIADSRGRLDLEPFPTIYQTPAQIPDDAMALMNGSGPPRGVIVRSRQGIDAINIGMAVREELEAAVDVPVLNVRTMERVIADSVTRRRSTLLIVGLFAGVAFLLASVGVYGVVSYGVRRRVREIGLRTALGAGTGHILRLLLLQTLRTTAIGALLGGVGSLALAPVLRAQLFGIEPRDPLTLTAVPLTLLCVALVAASIPALQASRVNPTTALRDN